MLTEAQSTRRTPFYLLPDPRPPCTTRIGFRFSANCFSARRSDFFFSRRFFRASGLRSNHWQRGHVSTLCAGFLRLQRRGVRPVLLTTMTLSEGLRAAARRDHQARARHSQARCRCRPCRQSTRFSVGARRGTIAIRMAAPSGVGVAIGAAGEMVMGREVIGTGKVILNSATI